ncbi:MAG: FAA hydrolase family protein [Candidatus Thorarchaeota archaeon]|nr:FAA hydrolase family protein [Candidatus Thorarchaeota archaeon]
MKLVSYSRNDVDSIAVQIEDTLLDIPEASSWFNLEPQLPARMIGLLSRENGVVSVAQIVKRFSEADPDDRPRTHAKASVHIRAPIARPRKIIGLGLNYKGHIEETGKETPEFPVIFAKFPSSVMHPDQDISIPKVTRKLDWEVELGIVIGRACKDVLEKDALEYIAGYTIINDLSARDLQKGESQWVRGKSLDGLCPMGPCIVTTDELGAASDLKMQTKVNGVLKQDSNTSNLLYDVPQVVSYLSESFTLEPGDVIATGTPSGVGFARNPPEFLHPGDNVELFIEGIGFLRNRIV